jgi:hypothetical protein
MDQTDASDFGWANRPVQVNGNGVDAIVGPVSSVVHIRSSLHVAVRKMDFDIQIVLSAAHVVFSSSDPEIEHVHPASTAVLLQQSSGLRFEEDVSPGSAPLPMSCVREQYADNRQKSGANGNTRMPRCAHRFLLACAFCVPHVVEIRPNWAVVKGTGTEMEVTS